MARIDEKDPRWIVEERADGANVNGWHWVEKDAMDWSRRRLAELFTDKALIDDSSIKLNISGLESLSGEAIINNRKQKIIPAYELEAKFSWVGLSSGQEIKGKIALPYISDENIDEEPELQFTPETETPLSRALKEAFLVGPGKKLFMETLNKFLGELRAGGPALVSQAGLSPPAPKTQTPKPKLTSALPEEVKGGSKAAAAASAAASPGKPGKTNLNFTERFTCRPMDLYECFMNEGRFRAFTQSHAVVEPRAGGRFEWFGGSVQGNFTEVQPGRKISMRWRFTSWQDDCYSDVVLELEEPEAGQTVVKLSQQGIPETDRLGNEGVVETVQKGWHGLVFMRIRQVFGFGLGL